MGAKFGRTSAFTKTVIEGYNKLALHIGDTSSGIMSELYPNSQTTVTDLEAKENIQILKGVITSFRTYSVGPIIADTNNVAGWAQQVAADPAPIGVTYTDIASLVKKYLTSKGVAATDERFAKID